MRDVEHLFVYGSWHPGYVHFRLLQDGVEILGPTTVVGSVYRSSIGFPVLTAQGEDAVPGALLRWKDAVPRWQRLDEFHGLNGTTDPPPYFSRQCIECAGLRGRPIKAMVFVAEKQRLPTHWPKIPRGNWAEDLCERPDLVSQLSQKHQTYLERLGASKGSAPLPSDLALYRELLKLKLIIDRGRTIGLTPLGKEAIKYLPSPAERHH